MRSGIVGLSVLLLTALALLQPSIVFGEVIYKPGDWVRYRYVIRTVNDTCIWTLRITIEWINETHVKYSGGLGGLVSGGSICQPLTALLILGLSLETENPVELSTTTPASKPSRTIINPSYTGTYTHENATVTYYKGILVSYYANATAPVVGRYEAIAIDTSIEELKTLLTSATAPVTTIAPTQASTTTPQPSLTQTSYPASTSTTSATPTPQPSPVQTTTTPSSGVSVYLILGGVIVVVALLMVFLITRRSR